jgi:hypothetical protein
MYPGPPPPPPKRNTTKTVLVIVGLVLALCCCGSVIGGIAIYRTTKSAVQPVQTAVDTFLDHLEAGETSTAYASLCQQARDQFTPAQFDQIISGLPEIAGHKLVSAFVQNRNGFVSATADAELRYADGSSETHTFQLAKNGDEWHVCGNPY